MDVFAQFGNLQRKLPPPDTCALLARMLEDPPETLTRAYARVYWKLMRRAIAEVRAELARRQAARAEPIETALADAARGYWLLARVAAAGALRYSGLAHPNPTPDLRRWIYRDRVVSIDRR